MRLPLDTQNAKGTQLQGDFAGCSAPRLPFCDAHDSYFWLFSFCSFIDLIVFADCDELLNLKSVKKSSNVNIIVHKSCFNDAHQAVNLARLCDSIHYYCVSINHLMILTCVVYISVVFLLSMLLSCFHIISACT